MIIQFNSCLLSKSQAIKSLGRKIAITAAVPKVTCDLPVHSVPFGLKWEHSSGLPLADPTFGQSRRIDNTWELMFSLKSYNNAGNAHLVLQLSLTWNLAGCSVVRLMCDRTPYLCRIQG